MKIPFSPGLFIKFWSNLSKPKSVSCLGPCSLTSRRLLPNFSLSSAPESWRSSVAATPPSFIHPVHPQASMFWLGSIKDRFRLHYHQFLSFLSGLEPVVRHFVHFWRREPSKVKFMKLHRDQPQKVYVQHKIRDHSHRVWSLLSEGAAVYVAGSSTKMPSDVLSAFEEIVAKESGLPKESAVRWLRTLEKLGKYHVEAWS